LTKSALFCAVVPLALALGITAASATNPHVNGQVCGVKACADLPNELVVQLSQRDDTFVPKSKPKPFPYYKVVVKVDGTEGYVSARIIWVPSKHLFHVWYDIEPPLPGYWRSGNKAYETQFMDAVHAAALKPFPAKRHYK
jgi:hypothetical protein